jgi:choline dehydrogenase-like flavoprotein
MGDADAVVDQYSHVRGVKALRVANASIMPNVPRANANLTSIMIGSALPNGCVSSDRQSAPPERTKARTGYRAS